MTLDRNAEKQEVPINPETGKPYINTLAAVAISPAGASPEKSTYVAQAVDVIRQSGLPSETNAMFTNIEGDIDDVLKVIRDATMKLAGQGYRTDVVIRLDIRPGFEVVGFSQGKTGKNSMFFCPFRGIIKNQAI